MRLIDADKLFDYIQKEKAWKVEKKRYRYDEGVLDAYYDVLDIINEQETVDPYKKNK